MAEVPNELRAKLCLALDVDDMVEAVRLAKTLSPWFGSVKVGLELYTSDSEVVPGRDVVVARPDEAREIVEARGERPGHVNPRPGRRCLE